MRRLFIAGNWKMNLSRHEGVELAEALVQRVGANAAVDVAICPPSIYLDAVGRIVAASPIGLGAQNVYHEPNGAFTGELSTAMLTDVGCKYVILGHSERRHIMGESNEDVNKKVVAALNAGLTPILCVGETIEEREAGKTMTVVTDQFDGSLASLTSEEVSKVVVAYEPVWAIGTGKVATPDQAEEVHADLRTLIQTRYNADVAAEVRIQYGGSVKPSNAAELLGQPNIDGALVGGASLTADDFIGIIEAAV